MTTGIGTVGVHIEGDWDKFRADAKREAGKVGGSISNGIKSATSGIGGIGKSIAKGIGVGAVALTGLGALASGIGIKSAADLETLNVALVQLTGSEEAAKAQMEELVEFAATTPFELPGLAKAQNALLATGKIAREEVIPTMRGIGDSVAALGGSTADVEAIGLALQKSFAKGKVELETLNQISERGIPIMGELAEQMNVSEGELADLISQGKVAPDVLAEAFQSPIGPLANFQGATEKLSQTFSGVWSTLKDTIVVGLGQALTPALQALTPAMQTLIPVVGDLIGVIGPLVGDLLTALAGILGRLLPLITPLIETIGTFLVGAIEKVAHWFGWAAEAILPLIDEVLPLLLDVIMTLLDEGLRALLPSLILLAKTVAKLLPPIFEVVGALLDALLPILGDLVGEISLALVPIVEVLADLLSNGLGDVLIVVLDLLKPFIPVIGMLAELISAVLTPVIGALSGALEVIADWLSNLTPAFEDLASKISEGLAIAIEKVREWFADLPAKVKGWLINAGDWLVTSGKDIVTGLWNGLKSMASWIREKVIGFVKDVIPGPLKAVLGISSPSKLMAEFGGYVGEGLAEGILSSEREVAKASNRLAAAAGVSASGEFEAVVSGAASSRLSPVVMQFNAPVGGSMAEFAQAIERERALTARFASG